MPGLNRLSRRIGRSLALALPVRFSPSRATDPAAYPSGGGGMVGTADDDLRFVEAVRLSGGGPATRETPGCGAGAASTAAIFSWTGKPGCRWWC